MKLTILPLLFYKISRWKALDDISLRAYFERPSQAADEGSLYCLSIDSPSSIPTAFTIGGITDDTTEDSDALAYKDIEYTVGCINGAGLGLLIIYEISTSLTNSVSPLY